MAPRGGGALAGRGGRGQRPADYYRAYQRVFINDSNEVVMRFHQTDIVRIRASGDVVLTTGGYFTQTTLQSMNDVLRHLSMLVSCRGHPANGSWQVTDDTGERHTYADNMVIPGKAAQHRSRGRCILEKWELPVPARLASSDSAATAAAAQQPATAQAQPPQQRQPATVQPPPQQPREPPPPPQPPVPAAPPILVGRSWAAAVAPRRPPAAAAALPAPPQQQAAVLPRPSVEDQLAAAAGRLGLQDDVAEEDLCIVCMDKLRQVVLVPCGHMVLCVPCCSDVLAKHTGCPVCRVDIAQHVEVNF